MEVYSCMNREFPLPCLFIAWYSGVLTLPDVGNSYGNLHGFIDATMEIDGSIFNNHRGNGESCHHPFFGSPFGGFCPHDGEQEFTGHMLRKSQENIRI
jgi:hypothetical protein